MKDKESKEKFEIIESKSIPESKTRGGGTKTGASKGGASSKEKKPLLTMLVLGTPSADEPTPQTITAARHSKFWTGFAEAIKELRDLDTNNTWTYVDRHHTHTKF